MTARDELPLILASSSPRRQEILSSAGVEFEVIPSEVNENFLPGESSEEHVVRLARMKALKATEKHKDRWVLAADTIVVIDGKILKKPRDRREAEEMLRRLSDREHRVITGYCLMQASSRRSREGKVITRIRFKALSSEEICWYLNTGEPFDKAGGYAIQGKAAFMVKEINGSYTNVVGLPLTEVIEALKELGAVDLFH
jgi:septum formation protein